MKKCGRLPFLEEMNSISERSRRTGAGQAEIQQVRVTYSFSESSSSNRISASSETSSPNSRLKRPGIVHQLGSATVDHPGEHVTHATQRILGGDGAQNGFSLKLP